MLGSIGAVIHVEGSGFDSTQSPTASSLGSQGQTVNYYIFCILFLYFTQILLKVLLKKNERRKIDKL